MSGCACIRMPGTFFPPSRVSDPKKLVQRDTFAPVGWWYLPLSDTVVCFTKEGDTALVKPPLNFNGGLAKPVKCQILADTLGNAVPCTLNRLPHIVFVFPQHPRPEIVPDRMGSNNPTIDDRWLMCTASDIWLIMLMFNASLCRIFYL